MHSSAQLCQYCSYFWVICQNLPLNRQKRYPMLHWKLKTTISCFGIQKTDYTLRSNMKTAIQNENKNTQNFGCLKAFQLIVTWVAKFFMRIGSGWPVDSSVVWTVSNHNCPENLIKIDLTVLSVKYSSKNVSFVKSWKLSCFLRR